MRHKLILISVDAMTGEELDELLTMPNASRLSGGARVSRVRAVYPTLTYPCHASLITGCFPVRTGIANNLVFAPESRPIPWHWERAHNREPDDLLFASKRAGLSTASVFWPGTGHHSACDFLIPEYWPQGLGDTVEAAMTRMGSSSKVLEILQKKPCPDLSLHPLADEFAMSWGCQLLQRYHPDVLLLHPANLDEAKHKYGIYGLHVSQALREVDGWIGRLFHIVEENGDEAVTNFVLTSDHGQLDVRKVFLPNVSLRDGGFIRTDDAGNLVNWDAFCLPAGMCFEVRLRDPADKNTKNRLYELLENWSIYGVTRIWTKEEAEEEEHLSSGFDFFCEMDGETAVSGAFTGEILRFRGKGDPAATHGYHPDRGPQPTFLCKGPSFAEDLIIPQCSLTDEAPTLAEAMGISLPRAEGRVLFELLRR